MLSGDLADFPLAEQAWFYANRRMSGWLTVTTARDEVTFTIEDGRVTGATSKRPEDGLGHLLRERRVITSEQLSACLSVQRWWEQGSPKPLGQLLVDMGWLSTAEVQESVRAHIAELLFRLLQQPHGTFVFRAGNPEAVGVPVEVPLEHEVLRAVSRADEWWASQSPGQSLRHGPIPNGI